MLAIVIYQRETPPLILGFCEERPPHMSSQTFGQLLTPPGAVFLPSDSHYPNVLDCGELFNSSPEHEWVLCLSFTLSIQKSGDSDLGKCVCLLVSNFPL